MRIAVAITALSAAPAFAENWADVTRTPEGALVSVDKDSTEISAGHVKFWDRTVLPAAQLIGIYDDKLMKAQNINGVTHYVEMRGYRDVNCQKHLYGTSAVNYYDAKGTAVSKGLQDAAPTPIAPGTLAAQEAKLMCPSS